MKSLSSLLIAGLALTTAAVLRAQTNTFPSSGNTGLGTTSPQAMLEVVSPDVANTYSSIYSGGRGGGFTGFLFRNSYWNSDGTSGAGYIRNLDDGVQGGILTFGTTSDGSGTTGTPTERMRIMANGNVGIGTTAPGNALSVTGEISASNGFRIWNGDNGDDVNNAPWYGLGISNLNLTGSPSPAVQLAGFYGLNFETQSGQMVVTQSGNVGIGTTAPTAPLQVVAPAGSAVPVVFQSPTPNSYVSLVNSGGNNSISSSNNNLYIGGGGIAGNLYFRNGWTTNMVVNANGNVGIGTSSPTYPLSVNGTIQAKEVLVQTGWSDYVFDSHYRLASLNEVAADIQKDHHLPGLPSAAEVAAHGVSLGDMQAKLLAKVED